jgi:hypothetical protein
MNVTDEVLDGMRRVGDPLVDPLVSAYEAQHGAKQLGGLLGQLFAGQGMPPDHPLVRAYESQVPVGALGDPSVIARGQRLFALFGPEVLLILGSYALPLAYAAGNGVQAIYRARRLKEDPLRRLCDTAQMVLNVMQEGEWSAAGIGLRSARKVRLIHAIIRRLVQSDPRCPWDPLWGEPINQEDLTGTLLTFSAVVLHGLRRMGARIPQVDADAYIAAWTSIARVLGLEQALLPADESEAVALAHRIGARQVRGTDQGQELAAELLEAVGTLFPIKGYAASLSHFFLEDTIFGTKAAEALKLPPANWTRWLVTLRALQKRVVLWALAWVPGARRRRSFIARRFAQAMLLIKRPDERVPFEVPDSFLVRWRLRPARQPLLPSVLGAPVQTRDSGGASSPR